MNYDYSDISTDGIRNVINGSPLDSREALIKEIEKQSGVKLLE